MDLDIHSRQSRRSEILAVLEQYFVARKVNDLVLRSAVGFEFDGREEWIRGILDSGNVHDDDYRMFRLFTESDGVFLDIGANYGYSATSVWAAGAKCAVISFEPILAFKPCLQAIESLKPGLFDYRMVGLGSRKGKVLFVTPVVNAVAVSALTTASNAPHLESMANNIEGYIDEHMGGVRDVKLRFFQFESIVETLDNVFARGDFRVQTDRVAAIKIDTEGLEFDVLEGAIETLRRHRPMVMLEGGNRIPGVEALMAQLQYFYAERDDMVLRPFVGKSVRGNGFFLHRDRTHEYRALGLLESTTPHISRPVNK